MVVLIGGLMAIVVPAIQALGGLDLKNEITRIAGLSSEVYALAAISGKTHRIIFDLDNQNYWVEEKVGDAGEIKPELGYEDLMKARIERSSQEKEALQRFVPSYREVKGPLGEKYQLPKDVVLHGVWTEQMNEVGRVGQIAIYYFTGGYTQSAFVSLSIKGEEEESSIYFALSPLTGAIEINLGEPEIKDLLTTESEK